MSGVAASMEPQLFSCGLLPYLGYFLCRLSMLQWSRNFSVADWFSTLAILIVLTVSFNGAATFQLRIVAKSIQSPHNHSASMEPQLFSCGLPAYSVKHGINRPCFNGAATFQLRIARVNVRDHRGSPASMEPQLFSCGLPKLGKR